MKIEPNMLLAPKKILVVAGGTGGHIFPALAVANELKKNNIVEWLGSKKGMENSIVPKHNIKLNTISIVGLRGKNILFLLKAFFLIIYSFFQTFFIFYRFKPNAVLAMGGYVSGLAGVMSKVFRVPLVIQEQNAIAGSTNKILSKLTKNIFQAFDNTLPNVTVVTSGNPINFKAQKKQVHQGLNCLVLGGSLGAKVINKTVDKLDLDINILHQVGKLHFKENDMIKKNVKKVAFIEDMANAYAWADIVICRAGAMTISELMLSASASILIPLPHAIDNHQLLNAKILENNNAGVILEQKDLTVVRLSQQLSQFNNKQGLLKLQKMSQNAVKLAKPQATKTIADFIISL